MQARLEYDVNAKRSYMVMFDVFRMLQLPREPRVLDLTYGVGRFYRKIVEEYKPFIIGVDVVRHNWEVPPSVFIQRDARTLTLRDLEQYGRIDVVVVDPPWSALKRGVVSSIAGYSRQPYHIKHVDPYPLITKAIWLSRQLGSKLVARFMEPLPCARIVVRDHIVVFRKRGVVYYSICF